MQLIKLEHGHWNFFCPVAGKAVYAEEGGINAEIIDSFRRTKGCWSAAGYADLPDKA